jgi:hypothetical protein
MEDESQLEEVFGFPALRARALWQSTGKGGDGGTEAAPRCRHS